MKAHVRSYDVAYARHVSVSAVHVGERTCKACERSVCYNVQKKHLQEKANQDVIAPRSMGKTCERSVCYNVVKKYIQENANMDVIAPPTQRTRGNKKHQVDMSGCKNKMKSGQTHPVYPKMV